MRGRTGWQRWYCRAGISGVAALVLILAACSRERAEEGSESAAQQHERAQAYPAGSVILLPSNTSHFHWAKSGEYVTQVTAIGPLGLEYLDPGDDPREIAPYLRGFGTTRFLSSETSRNGQPAALAVDIVALMDALKIEKAVLGGFDWGARTANIIAALWPERCKAQVAVSGYLVGSQEASKVPLPPKAELQWWYQFYFATERGRADYDKYRHDFAKLIWQLASPKWNFDDATYERSAASFDNSDHVSIAIHNYRRRLGLAAGESKYDDLEKRLAECPVITVPTITLEGDANGAPHPEPSAMFKKFTGKYSHRTLTGDIGHNLLQEAPNAFADAIVEADHL